MLVVGVATVAVVVMAALLLQPSPKAAFAVSARTGSLTLEPLCGERVVWDLPAGRITRRSALPGDPQATRVTDGHVSIALFGGSRARLESTSPGTFRMTVGRAESTTSACNTGGRPYYELSVDDGLLADDSQGISYSAVRPAAASKTELSLLLSGRAVIGDAVQQGAGWDTQPAMLESGSVGLRVVPWFGDDRVTLRTEQLEEGSLFDTHACLSPKAAANGRACPLPDAKPAVGFLRTRPEGGMTVQLYVNGAVGAQPFGGEQRVLRISESTAAWHSPALGAVTSLLLLLFGLYQAVKTLVKDGIEWWNGRADQASPREVQDEGATPASAKTRGTITTIIVLLAAASAAAEPVEVRQGSYVGAGYTFKHGTACLVVTARHVVQEMGGSVTVLDRGGAAAQGSRSYDNESYDLALIALPEKSPVACTSNWPETAWIAPTNFSGPGEFRVIRHYPNGRETIVRLTYAGSMRQSLTLGYVDRLRVRESDSGAIVEYGGRPVGIVQSVDTATDRVNVLKFDAIDQLVGDRFRSRANAPVAYAGVFQRGRQHPEWSTYVQAWLTDKARRPVIHVEPPSPVRQDPRRSGGVTSPARGAAKALCEVKIDVMSWERQPVPNPEYSKVELGLKACGNRNIVFQQMCTAARNAQRSTPRQIMSQKVTFQATVAPQDGPAFAKLETRTVIPPASASLGRTELELLVLQDAVGPTLTSLLDAAPCQ